MVTIKQTYEEFLNLPIEEQKRLLTIYRNTHTNAEITKAWSINVAKLYKLIDNLNLPKAESRKKASQTKKATKPTPASATLPAPAPVAEISKPDPTGFDFHLKGKYTSDELIKRMEKVSLMLVDEKAKFKVDLVITEG